MIFYNQTHEKTYRKLCSKDDRELNAIAYLCALSEAIADGSANRLFDFDRRTVKPCALQEPWQTSNTIKITSALLNMWNGYVYREQATIFDLFGACLDRYLLQAIRLRYDICD